MSSDADYAAFLEKANQDTSGASTSTNSKKGGDSGFANTKTTDTSVPAVLKSVDAFYQSDTDEPFEPVALKFGKKKSLDGEAFGKLVGHKGDVEEVKVKEWNVKDVYADVVKAVEEAGSGDVKVFRVEHGSTRCEYYVVTVNEEGVVVGFKARAVES